MIQAKRVRMMLANYSFAMRNVSEEVKMRYVQTSISEHF